MNKNTIINYINSVLCIDEFLFDSNKNGLIVDNSKQNIKRVGYAVDATNYIIEKCALNNIDILITHHGIFWGKEQVITGVEYDRIKKLIIHDIALLSYHLPLDSHNELGNNIGIIHGLISKLSLSLHNYSIQDFYSIHGKNIGNKIIFSSPIKIISIVEALYNIGLKKDFYNFGEKDYIHSIGVVSGAGGSILKDKNLLKDIDFFVTGEGTHDTITYAKETKKSFLFGGHYETEVFGIQALAKVLRDTFSVDIIYIDEKY